MGDMRSAIAEDEDDWDDLKKKANILNTTWKLYSKEHQLAKEGFDKGYKGPLLVKYVGILMELDHLEKDKAKDMEEYALYQKLKRKYEGTKN